MRITIPKPGHPNRPDVIPIATPVGCDPSGSFNLAHRAGRGTELTRLNPHSIQHADIDIREGLILISIEGDVTPVSESAARQQDWQV